MFVRPDTLRRHAIQEHEWSRFENDTSSFVSQPAFPGVQQRLADIGTGKPGGIVLAVSAIGLIFGVTVIVVFYCLMRCYVTVERKRVFGARRKFGRIPSEAHRPPHPDDCEEFEFIPDKASDEEEPPAFVFGQKLQKN